MKSKLITAVLGLFLLAGSAVVSADSGRGRDHHSQYRSWHNDSWGARRYDAPRYREHYRPRSHGYRHHDFRPRHWHYAPHRHHWRPAPRFHHRHSAHPHGRGRDGVTIIFRGHID
jgi:hypothetical protein